MPVRNDQSHDRASNYPRGAPIPPTPMARQKDLGVHNEFSSPRALTALTRRGSGGQSSSSSGSEGVCGHRRGSTEQTSELRVGSWVALAPAGRERPLCGLQRNFCGLDGPLTRDHWTVPASIYPSTSRSPSSERAYCPIDFHVEARKRRAASSDLVGRQISRRAASICAPRPSPAAGAGRAGQAHHSAGRPTPSW